MFFKRKKKGDYKVVFWNGDPKKIKPTTYEDLTLNEAMDMIHKDKRIASLFPSDHISLSRAKKINKKLKY